MRLGETIQRALLSVYDKTGLTGFARRLVDTFGCELISTGGTARELGDAGLGVTLVESVTGFPEMLDGRVKTLHPHIHGGILARRARAEDTDALARAGIQPIDLVVVNLYPFEQTAADPSRSAADIIEMIDIGGPCLLRAAAKNHADVLVLSSPDQYELAWTALHHPANDPGVQRLRRELAQTAFAQTQQYDAAIASWLAQRPAEADPG